MIQFSVFSFQFSVFDQIANGKSGSGLPHSKENARKAAATWLGGGVAGMGGEGIDRLLSFGRDADARVEEFGEDFDAGD